jgi:hypothetical protein
VFVVNRACEAAAILQEPKNDTNFRREALKQHSEQDREQQDEALRHPNPSYSMHQPLLASEQRQRELFSPLSIDLLL